MQSVTVERRGCGLGCIIAALGLVLGCCLLPYLMSSMYSITTSVLQVPGAPGWLWGDLLNEFVESGSAGYMLFAEGPICCVGSLALLIIVFGILMLVTSLGRRDEEAGEIYEPHESAQIAYSGEYAQPEGDSQPEGYGQPEGYSQSPDYGQAYDEYPTQVQNSRSEDYRQSSD